MGKVKKYLRKILAVKTKPKITVKMKVIRKPKK